MHKIESDSRFIAAGCIKAVQIFHALASADDKAAPTMTAMCRPALRACLHCYAARAR
jgi:hypothetical protein